MEQDNAQNGEKKTDIQFFDLLMSLGGDDSEDDWEKLSLSDVLERIRNEKTQDRQWKAINALSKMGKEVVPDLIQALQDADWRIRDAAAMALGEMGAIEAAPALLQMFRECRVDDAYYVRESLAHSLGNLRFVEAIPDLIASLRCEVEDDEVRVAALHALGNFPEAIPDLRQMLQDESWENRWLAAEALADLEATEAIPDLIQALTDQEWIVRKRAAESLRRLRAKEAIPALKQALKDEQEQVRQEAEQALKDMGVCL